MAKKKYEGSAKDMMSDRTQAKKRKMPAGMWEKSASDGMHDVRGMASGGKVRGAGAALRGTKFSKA